MNKEQLIEYFGDIDEHYVKEAAPGNRPAKKRRWALAGAAAAVVVLAAVGARAWEWTGSSNGPALPDPAPPANIDNVDGPGIQGVPPIGDEAISGEPGCAAGHIRWHGHVYADHGQAVHEMPEGLELLGEVTLGVKGGVVPEDAPDLSGNFGDGGSAYWFPGNDSLIVFRYKEWDPEVELGRKEPILLMFREFGEEEPHQPGRPYYTLSDLVRDSDVIVEGTDAQPGGAVPAGVGEAVYTLQAAGVLRGRVAAEMVRVRVPADSGVLEPSGEGRYLLFLRREADGTFRPVSTSQGVYPIKGKFLHVPASDPCRFQAFPILHTDDSDFWYGVNNVREWIGELQSGEPHLNQ